MKILILFCCLSCSAMDRFEALSQIESGDCDTCLGASGEVSQYQILPLVWRQYTKLPLAAASNSLTARNVAICVMENRVWHFVKKQHRQPTDSEFYLLWHRPARVDHPRPVELERAQRFSNLCRRQ
jgi:hypothetical protein